jgi:hypothetical protein
MEKRQMTKKKANIFDMAAQQLDHQFLIFIEYPRFLNELRTMYLSLSLSLHDCFHKLNSYSYAPTNSRHGQ